MSRTTATGGLGLDKLQFFLSTSEVQFSPSADVDVQPARFNPGTREARPNSLLWRSTAGNSIFGARAFVNCDDYHLTIEPHKQTGTSITTLHFSAGAFSDTNCEPLDHEATRSISTRVSESLRQRGISLDLDGATLTRCDIAENVALDEPVSSYGPVFSGAGARKRVSKMDFGGTGFVVGNTRWELALYDKGEEMKGKGIEVQMRPVNTLRPELRLMRSAVMKERLGLSEARLPALLERWEALRPAHRAALRKDLLCWGEEAAMPSPMDFDGAVEYTQGARYHFQAFLALNGAANLVREMGAPAAKQYIARKFMAGGNQRRKMERLLDGAAFRLEMDGTAPSGRTRLELYRELESKLLAA